jgi:hypothetical protein
MATCETCRFWSIDDDAGGECRRYAPRPATLETASDAWQNWPATLSGDWCGEHQPKEPTP